MDRDISYDDFITDNSGQLQRAIISLANNIRSMAMSGIISESGANYLLNTLLREHYKILKN